jgi:hypothetical protein
MSTSEQVLEALCTFDRDRTQQPDAAAKVHGGRRSGRADGTREA